MSGENVKDGDYEIVELSERHDNAPENLCGYPVERSAPSSKPDYCQRNAGKGTTHYGEGFCFYHDDRDGDMSKRLEVQEKMIRLVRDEGKALHQACSELEIEPNSVYQWPERTFREELARALRSNEKADHQTAKGLFRKKVIKEIKSDFPNMRPRTAFNYLKWCESSDTNAAGSPDISVEGDVNINSDQESGIDIEELVEEDDEAAEAWKVLAEKAAEKGGDEDGES